MPNSDVLSAMSLNSFVNPCISLPVVKYSFSTALNSAAGRFAWEHVHNVVIVFDSFRNNARPSSCPSRCLKVVDGTKTLVGHDHASNVCIL